MGLDGCICALATASFCCIWQIGAVMHLETSFIFFPLYFWKSWAYSRTLKLLRQRERKGAKKRTKHSKNKELL